MDTTTIPPHPAGDTREVRALRLYRERGSEIVRTSPCTYLVPSCTGTGSWAVNYRAERCDCPDFERRGVACKHVYAVGIHRAKRRGTTTRRLRVLEDRYEHEDLDPEERLEVWETIIRLRPKFGL